MALTEKMLEVVSLLKYLIPILHRLQSLLVLLTK